MNDLIVNLSRLKPFEEFNVGELEALFRKNGSWLEHYSMGEIIKHRGDKCNALLLLLKGKVSTEMQDTEGKRVVLEKIEAPSILASAILFSSEPTMPVDIVASDKTVMLSMKKELILELCMTKEKFLRGLLKDMGDRVTLLAKKVYFFSLNSLKEKLSQYLLEKAAGKSELTLEITKDELASFFGVTRPSLSRAFSELAKEGMIIQEGKRVKLINKNALRKLGERE
ncbi:hypothetical protein AT15_03965 [Kosmotoga arenicorallina S304]|uniref:Crp/Fnr family transcriptional regulator n=1 Tax=Kosmotoga arenicorallina S304 TaxID=1453497 RepID=A0A176JYX6_9BACT|nr:hypothetical protein AT15_03965 [Kosmotoga arenicorallina S304]